MYRLYALSLLIFGSGCAFLPEISYQPTVHNPFPQLSRIAVAPFANLSTEPTINGRDFAEAYFSELQAIPGYEVVPVGVTEQAMRDLKISPTGPKEMRRLAQALEVDAVVFGAVTEYTPYYPPRCGLRVEWYAANPCLHPIPVGYGLPWGTPEAEEIPANLVHATEFGLAKAQMATQTPIPDTSSDGASKLGDAPTPEEAMLNLDHPPMPGFPPDWPDPARLHPPGPHPVPDVCIPSNQPVLEHTRIFNGHDADFTTALETYYHFQDDLRFGGPDGYLQRSEDFIRFCCHLHITEMLTARGGAGETRVVWRWQTGR
jgi:hypothetical protein